MASRAFPVLRAANAAPMRDPGSFERGPLFSAVSTLLAQVAEQRSCVVALVDDLQWSDADSVALLSTIVEEAPARVALLATLRDDVESAATPLIAGPGAEARAA